MELPETYKQILRFLVLSVRDKRIDEEFAVNTDAGVLVVLGDKVRNSLPVPNLTYLSLDVLEKKELIWTFRRPKEKPVASTQAQKFVAVVHYSLYDSATFCRITPDGYRAVELDFAPMQNASLRKPPVEIADSLVKFRDKYPDQNKMAFVMMAFADTVEHKAIYEIIRNALEPHSYVAIRADANEFHSNLFYNVLTYVFGCRFGIAVFDAVSAQHFNPNVSLELGYMLGLGKVVCYLKDRALPKIQTDLIGNLYRQFDPSDPAGTIPRQLFDWMNDYGFIYMPTVQEVKVDDAASRTGAAVPPMHNVPSDKAKQET